MAWRLEARRADEVPLPAGWRPGQRRTVSESEGERLMRAYPKSFDLLSRTAELAADASDPSSWTNGDAA